ncbi:MAG: peptidyl-prolyl cis-trans isomerase B (cyclophilin B) [Saprospiraceae bacterium]|jgi:peptidyl-prolyl cis-trans isomerase B (cyclophilin B)
MKKTTFLLLLTLTVIFTACKEKSTSDFNFEIPTGEAPADITFQNTSENADTYFWDFGDGTSSIETSPTHKYNFSGTYNVTLVSYKEGQELKSTKSFTLREAAKRIVEIETEFGIIKAELYNFTPKHRDNFLKLAEEGYYDGTLFHRVMQGFMIQGGDPDSKTATPNQALGMGDPGYTIPAEIVPGAYHYKGALAAGHNGNPEKSSSGSQFYIVQGTPLQQHQIEQYARQKANLGLSYSPAQTEYYRTVGGAPILDMNYTVFGQVIDGMHLIDQIAAVPVNQGNNSRPLKDVKMKVRVVK